MSTSLILAGAWALLANLLAMLPGRDPLWRRAIFLVAGGVPILGYVTYENGPVIGIMVLIAGMCILRWPPVHLPRWTARHGGRTNPTPGAVPPEG